jgi:hypothetical protein
VSSDHKRVLVRHGGLEYVGVVYWATDKGGAYHVVMALPMGSPDELGSVGDLVPGATPQAMLDDLVQRMGDQGFDVLPYVEPAGPAPKAN